MYFREIFEEGFHQQKVTDHIKTKIYESGRKNQL